MTNELLLYIGGALLLGYVLRDRGVIFAALSTAKPAPKTSKPAPKGLIAPASSSMVPASAVTAPSPLSLTEALAPTKDLGLLDLLQKHLTAKNAQIEADAISKQMQTRRELEQAVQAAIK